MTTQLIPVFNGTISNESALLVNARDLHEFLGVGKVFAAWITSRIEEYGFAENQDYLLLSKTGKQTSGRGGHNRKDYHLTLDTAKELAMVERNEQGRQVRRYFIECERQLRDNQSHTIPPSGYDTRTLCYKRSGVTVNEFPLREDDLVISMDSWLDLARKNGWIVLRREGLAGRLSLAIEQSLA